MDSTTLPPIEGARTAQPLDAMRISWWVWRGRRYAARATHGWTRAIRTAAVGISCAAWPLATLRRATSIRFGRTRYYFSHDDTAVVAVRSTRDGWLLTDYCSAHPGQGEGCRRSGRHHRSADPHTRSHRRIVYGRNARAASQRIPPSRQSRARPEPARRQRVTPAHRSEHPGSGKTPGSPRSGRPRRSRSGPPRTTVSGTTIRLDQLARSPMV